MEIISLVEFRFFVLLVIVLSAVYHFAILKHSTLVALRPKETCLGGERHLKNASEKELEYKKKLILFWTTWYGMINAFGFGYEFGDSLFKNCPVSNCIARNNRSMANESDAVMFHTWTDDMKVEDLPQYRLPHQRFVMFYADPPTFLPKSVLNPLPPH